MKVLKEKWKGLKNSYDNKVWNINKVIEAFKTQEVLIEFVRYKLETKETYVDIPIAIGKKLKYQDRAFFRSFTNKHETRPAHQNEFMDLLEMTTNKYKQAYGAYVINKQNKYQIYDKLRKKLGIDFLTNANFMFMDSFEITQMIFFIAGFAKLKNDLKFEEFRKKVNELKSEVLVQLPEDYNNIAVQIREALPYLLPIKDRRFVGR